MTTQPSSTDTSTIQPNSEQLFEYISSYPFFSDQEYQSGLAAILGHPETPASEDEIAQNQDLVLQAQCFYLARRHQLPAIDVDEYKRWLSTRNQHSQDTVETNTQSTTNGTKAAIQAQQPQPGPANNTASSPSTLAPLSAPDPIDRPHAPTPSTAAAASTLDVQPHSQVANTEHPAESANATAGQGPAPPYPTSFADIVDLITQNKPVPGIEEVPDTVLELGSSKRDTATRRRKPWETSAVEQETWSTDVDGRDSSEGGSALRQNGEGVLKILQPGAVPDSGLVAGD